MKVNTRLQKSLQKRQTTDITDVPLFSTRTKMFIIMAFLLIIAGIVITCGIIFNQIFNPNIFPATKTTSTPIPTETTTVVVSSTK